jgi:hypothetical protein
MAYRALVVVVASAVFTVLSARAVEAQAWVPSKGEGSAAILYQDSLVEDHLLASGARQDRGQIRSNNLLFDVTYGLTDRIALTLGVPFVRSRYTGAFPHPSPQDDGEAHSGFQDLRFGLRYNILQGPLAITPFVGTNMPTHKYATFSHAAFGPRVRELEVGAYVGRLLSPRLPDAFIQARYGYSFAQRIVGVHHDRSNLDLEIGYFVTPAVRIFALGAGQKTHGGIDLPDAGWRSLPPDQGPHHDRIARVDMLDAGGGVQISLTKSIEVFGSYMTTLAGRNGHALERAITIGASWSFERGGDLLGTPADTGQSMVKRLCQK